MSQYLIHHVKYSDIKKLKGMELREIFTSQQVVYIYHDQIDNAGENTEDDCIRLTSMI